MEGLPFPRINLSEVTGFYENLVADALAQVSRGRWAEAMDKMVQAARIAYLVNWRYQDSRIEAALKLITEAVLSAEDNPPAKGERIVFFDSWGLDARGLSLQYIRALNASGASILFICETRNEAGSVGLREELSKGAATETLYLDDVNNELEKARRIHASISAFRPSRILMHMTPWAVGAIVAFHAFSKVPRYQINLTDHAFWLGTGCSDYLLEFRDYGIAISQEKRGIAPERTILNPYYPIVEDSQSYPLPERKDVEVVVFSGGAFYKMYGREGYFFDIIGCLLDDNPNVVVWLAGNGRTTLLKERLGTHLESGRVKLIGNRKDINAVFQACDVYLSTYPFCGALMAQLATRHGVPILSFTSADLVTNRLEDIIGTDDVHQITHTDISAFRHQAAALIADAELRSVTAAQARSAMHDRNKFECRIVEILSRTEDQPRAPSKRMAIDYDAVTSLYLEIENYFQDELAKLLVQNTNLQSAVMFPLLTAKATLHVASFSLMKQAK